MEGSQLISRPRPLDQALQAPVMCCLLFAVRKVAIYCKRMDKKLKTTAPSAMFFCALENILKHSMWRPFGTTIQDLPRIVGWCDCRHPYAYEQWKVRSSGARKPGWVSLLLLHVVESQGVRAAPFFYSFYLSIPWLTCLGSEIFLEASGAAIELCQLRYLIYGWK